MFTARIVVLANARGTCGSGLVSGSDDKPATVEPALLQRAIALDPDGIRDSLARRNAPQK